MRVLPLLLAAGTALASSSSSPSSPDASSSPDPSEPTPAGQTWLAKWTDATLTPYTKTCFTATTFKAQIYTLGEMYPTLKEWAPQLKVFYNKQHYPGSWEGADVHGTGRELLKMALEDVPFKVREWLHKNPDQRHFSVHDDGVVFFAPGAIYPILPLFVDEPVAGAGDGLDSECEGVFDDLEVYAAEAGDGRVLGRVGHKGTGKNEVEVEVEAFLVKGGQGQGQGGKDEL